MVPTSTTSSLQNQEDQRDAIFNRISDMILSDHMERVPEHERNNLTLEELNNLFRVYLDLFQRWEFPYPGRENEITWLAMVQAKNAFLTAFATSPLENRWDAVDGSV